MSKPQVEIHTDGGCFPNPGDGAWAAILVYQGAVKEISGALMDTSNNRAEMTAVLMALKALKYPCQVILRSDSMYVVQCGAGVWARNANTDLWAEIDAAAKGHDIDWRWVKGHNGDHWNERCHALVQKAMRMSRPEPLF